MREGPFELCNFHGYFRLVNIPPSVSFVKIYNAYRDEVNNHPGKLGNLSPVTTPIILLGTITEIASKAIEVAKSCYLAVSVHTSPIFLGVQ